MEPSSDSPIHPRNKTTPVIVDNRDGIVVCGFCAADATAVDLEGGDVKKSRSDIKTKPARQHRPNYFRDPKHRRYHFVHRRVHHDLHLRHHGLHLRRLGHLDRHHGLRLDLLGRLDLGQPQNR